MGGRENAIDIGDVLVRHNFITSGQLHEAQKNTFQTNTPLKQELLNRGFVTTADIARAWSRELSVEFVDLKQKNPSPGILRMIPEHVAYRYHVVPLEIVDDKVILAMADPSDVRALYDVRVITSLRVVPVVGDESIILQLLDDYYKSLI